MALINCAADKARKKHRSPSAPVGDLWRKQAFGSLICGLVFLADRLATCIFERFTDALFSPLPDRLFPMLDPRGRSAKTLAQLAFWHSWT
jgi:hypothetical protein